MVELIRLHPRAPSRRSAMRTRRSGVILAFRATEERTIRPHHSGGIESRCGHFRAAATPTPMSAASLSGEPHSPTTSRKDETMHADIGQPVLKGKQIFSHDCAVGISHSVSMDAKRAAKIAESQWRQEFSARVKQARGTRTQQDMADLLEISQTTYSKYEGRRASLMPHRMLPRFCKICGVTLEWLIEGETAQQKTREIPKKRRQRNVLRI